MNLQAFMREIITLVTSRPSEQECERVPDDLAYRLTGRHFVSVKKALPDAKDQRPTKRCRVCYARGLRTANGTPIKTIYICKACLLEPGLHPDSCFEIYHTQLNYAEVETII